MRALFLALVMAIAFSVSVLPANANYTQSEQWFETFNDDDQILLQSQLILTGHYAALADGKFGRMTYEALVSLQRDIGDAPTGALSNQQLEALSAAAAEIYASLGMDIETDTRGRIVLIVPHGLLTERFDTRRGTAFTTKDGAIRLETIRKPISEQGFSSLYGDLSISGPGRSIGYTVFQEDWFVVSGRSGPRAFYMYFHRTPEDSVGYSVEWIDAEEKLGAMLATFLASYSYPSVFDEQSDRTDYKDDVIERPQPPSEEPKQLSAGSGFFVNDEGLIVTNSHVVEGCRVLSVPGYGAARIIMSDAELDLAAIRIEGTPKAWVRVRSAPVELGEDVFMLGYPLADLMGSSITMGTGIVSSETGLGGTEEWFTSNVGVQPGNSGGPILDERGHLVGVAVAKLDDGVMMADTGNVAPNFGFAIKNTEVLKFLGIFKVDTVAASKAGNAVSPRDLARGARDYTVQVLCES